MTGVFGLDLFVQDNSSWLALFILGGCSLCQARVGSDETGDSLFPEFVHARCSSEMISRDNSLFCSKNARASGHNDVWEGRAITKNTRRSWVTPEHGNY